MSSSITLAKANGLPSLDLGNVSVETQFKGNNGTQLQLILPANGSLANNGFRIRVSGRIATTSNLTFNVKMYFGLGAISANTLFFDCGAQTINNLKIGYSFRIDNHWSGDGQAITGWGAGQVGNNIVGPQTLTNVITAVNPSRDSDPTIRSSFYGFTLTGQFSGSSAGNHAYVDNFDMESM